MSKRKGISKSARFAIFSRDQFTCRYCGKQSDEVKLVIDHVIPVCQDGTNDQENLITSCVDCNAGKAGKTIEQSAPTETDRLRKLQECQEQFSLANAAVAASKARRELSQAICNEFCETFNREDMNKTTLGILVSFVEQHGPSLVYQWMGIARKNLSFYPSESQITRYMSGIRRNYLKALEEQRHA